ncbi:hypothetical protein AB4Y36_08250 [Paraburkholderia sp. BR10936]|uniref:hypothetical protein n=1 Tax=Paraburkholderia sp. BR10936 TaxID=3236993 RepID=UPI0034D29A30
MTRPINVTSRIPCPPLRQTYPFGAMQEGDSFAVPVAHVRRVREAAYRYSKRHREFRFTVRRTTSGEHRCWRIALARETLADYLPPEAISEGGQTFRIYNPFRGKAIGTYPLAANIKIALCNYGRSCDGSAITITVQLATEREIDETVDNLKAQIESLREPAKKELRETAILQLSPEP